MDRTIGVEREWFITRNGIIVPCIGELLPGLHKACDLLGLPKDLFTFELFAGQVEDRTPPATNTKELLSFLSRNENILYSVGNELDLKFSCVDFVESEALGKLCVNPFSQRHIAIWDKIGMKEKIAASQVAAIHIHISAGLEEAVAILNHCRIPVIDKLVTIGDFSSGKRINSYRTMAKTYGDPPLFNGGNELLSYIKERGGERDVWDLVRYKPSTNTVEFRMFGATNKNEKIIEFVYACQNICNDAVYNYSINKSLYV